MAYCDHPIQVDLLLSLWSVHEVFMSHVFPRHSHISAPSAVSGEGCYLIDSNGKRYLDGSGGAAVSCLGHNDAAVSYTHLTLPTNREV